MVLVRACAARLLAVCVRVYKVQRCFHVTFLYIYKMNMNLSHMHTLKFIYYTCALCCLLVYIICAAEMMTETMNDNAWEILLSGEVILSFISSRYTLPCKSSSDPCYMY